MKAINYLTAGAAMLGLAAFGSSALHSVNAKAHPPSAQGSPADDPAQWVGGTVFLQHPAPATDLGVGPFYVTDIAGTGLGLLAIIPSGSACSTVTDNPLPPQFLPHGANGARFLVQANQRLCAKNLDDSGFNPGQVNTTFLVWAGFRPY